ncbi:hypothetical protein [Shivajiella indica]|uniref:CBM-cenC domain-containing protein n=1 Tax=Shivajiella indica TaxID=872115 RepID=A0ABW5B5X6_9BACT
MKSVFNILFLSLALLFSCIDSKDPIPKGSQFLVNTDFSASPNSISPWGAVQAPGFNLGISQEVFRSGFQSVFIENLDSLNENTGTWRQSYNGALPREGRSLKLKAYIKGEDITLRGPGSNVYISMRAFPVEDSNGSTTGRFVTSQNRTLVSGTFDWEPLEITLPRLPEQVDFLMVYLVMGPRATGKVYFDDVTLTVE